MRKFKHIRVVIPEYGKREMTQKCVSSILKHNLIRDEDLEIYIGDDGYYKEGTGYPPGRAIFLPWLNNVGFAQNVNRTATIACGNIPQGELINTLLIICNSDILFMEKTILRLKLFLMEEENCICGPALELPQSYFAPETTGGPHPQLFSPEGFKTKAFGTKEVTTLSGAFICMTASHWFMLGGFDCENFPFYYEDDDFCIRANLRAIPSVVVYGAEAKHLACQTMDQTVEKYSGQFNKSKENFEKKWPEITWEPTGCYKVPVDIIHKHHPNTGDLCPGMSDYRGLGYSVYIADAHKRFADAKDYLRGIF